MAQPRISEFVTDGGQTPTDPKSQRSDCTNGQSSGQSPSTKQSNQVKKGGNGKRTKAYMKRKRPTNDKQERNVKSKSMNSKDCFSFEK